MDLRKNNKRQTGTLLFVLSLCTLTGWAQQPFEKLGYKVPVSTLTNGKYIEDFSSDSLVQVGSVVLNRVTGKIVSFVEYDTLYSEATLDPQLVSRWMSPDPLAEEYYSFSPYNFVLNNPIIYVDPDGQKVKPADKAAFNVLLNTLDPVSRKSVSLGSDGFVHINGSGSGSTFEALQTLVADDRTTEFIVSESFDFKDASGSKQTGSLGKIDSRSEVEVMFEAFEGNISKDDLIQRGFSDKPEDAGSFGLTLLPDGEKDKTADGRGSLNGNVIVIINSGLTDRNKARTAAHEGFGHALFFIQGKDPNHGIDRNVENQELENQINKVVNEAGANYDKNNK